MQVYQYIRDTWPYWNANEGRDHIWVLTDDHGACDEFARTNRVKDIDGSIFLTHFGYKVRPRGCWPDLSF